MSADLLLNQIVLEFIASAEQGWFNGTTVTSLLRIEPDSQRLLSQLESFVREGKVSCAFASVAINPHIKRLPDLPVERQCTLLHAEPLQSICLYPAAKLVVDAVDVTGWHDRPFSKELLLGEPQLAFRSFELAALERYLNDPRYDVRFFDYMGQMSVADEPYRDAGFAERNKVYLQSFGLGFDGERNPFVVVFLRYLSTLTPDHQQYWKSFLADGDIRLSEPYFKSSILGEFWDNRSVRYAIQKEIELINRITMAIWGAGLFRCASDEAVAIGLTSFLRPTAENFHRFAMSLDKLLSENIDVKFFNGRVAMEKSETRADGQVVVHRKGTLALLEDWLTREIVWGDHEEFRRIIIGPLREARRLRQKPAHTFTSNQFSEDYADKRKKLMWDVFNSLSNIRSTFAKHPRAAGISVPRWLDEGKIDVF